MQFWPTFSSVKWQKSGSGPVITRAAQEIVCLTLQPLLLLPLLMMIELSERASS
jgi:hypothetical protein